MLSAFLQGEKQLLVAFLIDAFIAFMVTTLAMAKVENPLIAT
jgi:hypothetical protein